MDPYFLAIIAIIIFTIVFILYVRISARASKGDSINPKPIAGDNDPLSHLKSNASDFTLLE